MHSVTMQYEILVLVLLVMLVLGGTTIYLAVSMLRGLRADDELIAQIARNLQYLLLEQGSLARSVRRAMSGNDAGKSGEEAPDPFDSSGLDELQAEGLSDISMANHDAHALLTEMASLDGRNLAAWKEANQARIQSLLAQQAALHRKLADSQETLDQAQKTIRMLKDDHARLAAAEMRIRSMEQVRAAQDTELAAAKAKVGSLQMESARIHEAMVEQEGKFKAMHEQYMKERHGLAHDKAALEERLAALQANFDARIERMADDEELQHDHDQYQAERIALEQEKAQLEERLQELQQSFDRTLREKTFIETAFLELDTSLMEIRLAAVAP